MAIDADGHWLEYGPVMGEELRRIGGEAAAEAWAVASQLVPNALKMSLAARRRRRIGQEDYFGCEADDPVIMFTNAVRFWGEVNPEFFQGTVVEKAAAAALVARS